jgi:hypothetical protein
VIPHEYYKLVTEHFDSVAKGLEWFSEGMIDGRHPISLMKTGHSKKVMKYIDKNFRVAHAGSKHQV